MTSIEAGPLSAKYEVSTFDTYSCVTNLLQHIWDTIYQIALKIFRFFSFQTENDNIFSKKEIQLLRDDQPIPKQPAAPDPPQELQTKKFKIVRAAETGHKILEPALKASIEPPYVTFDGSLENMREFLRSLSLLTVDVVNKHYIQGPIESFQESATSLPPIIKSISRLIVEMGNKASKPLFQKLAQHKTQVIDPALKKVLKVLLRGDDVHLRDELYEHLQDVLKDVAFSGQIEAIDYIEPILSWIFEKDTEKQSITSYFPPNANFDKTLIEVLCNQAQEFCVNRKNENLKNLYKILETKIHHELKSIPLPKSQDLGRDYIQPLLHWLLYSDQSQPIGSLFVPKERFDDNLIDKIFELSVTFIIEKKIDYFDTFLQKTFKQRLDEIVYRMLRINATRLIDFFSERFAELISSMDFTKTIDNIDTLFAKQVEGIHIAEKTRDVHRTVLAKAKQVAGVSAQTPEALKTKTQAEHHLESVSKHGSEVDFLHQIFLEKFSEQHGCNEAIRRIIKERGTQIQKGHHPGPAQKSIEKGLYHEVSDIIISLMLPIKKRSLPTGEIEEIDPFSEIWDRLNFPEEFLEIIKQIEELANEFITADTVALFSDIKKPTIDIVKNMFRTAARDLLKKNLVTILHNTFESLSKPSQIDAIAAESVLPTLNESLLQSLISQELGRHIKAFTPLFCTLLNDGSANRQFNIEAIKRKLIPMAQARANESRGKTDFVDNDWHRLALPVIEEIEKDILNKNGIDASAPYSQRDIEEFLNKRYQIQPSNVNNPIYGDIIVSLLCGLGEFNHPNLINFFVKDSLSAAITAATLEPRSSHIYLFDTVIPSLKASLLNKDNIEKMLTEEPPPSPAPVYIHEKLERQIDILCRIGYDVMIATIEDQGKLISFAAKKIIGSDSKVIKKIIKNVYTKLGSKQLINKNLIAQVCDEVLRSFSASSDLIARKQQR